MDKCDSHSLDFFLQAVQLQNDVKCGSCACIQSFYKMVNISRCFWCVFIYLWLSVYVYLRDVNKIHTAYSLFSFWVRSCHLMAICQQLFRSVAGVVFQCCHTTSITDNTKYIAYIHRNSLKRQFSTQRIQIHTVYANRFDFQNFE